MLMNDDLTLTLQGTTVPTLGFGTWQLEGDTARRCVRHALEVGYRHIDTAQMYENEAQVGQGIKDSGLARDGIFVTTKIKPDNARPKDVKRSMRESLQRLGLDAVDLVLLHWPNPDVPLADTLGAMSTLRDEGLTRHIGVSNFTPKLMREALDLTTLFALQCEYHPYLDQDALLAICREHDVMFTAYSPIAQGEVADDETIGAIAKRHGKSPFQVTLRWLIQQTNVSAIPRSSSKDHIRANFEVADFRLDEDEMARIAALRGDRRIVDPSFAPWK